MNEKIDQVWLHEWRNIVFKAWQTTKPCPDGSPFCPSCFFETFINLLLVEIND